MCKKRILQVHLGHLPAKQLWVSGQRTRAGIQTCLFFLFFYFYHFFKQFQTWKTSLNGICSLPWLRQERNTLLIFSILQLTLILQKQILWPPWTRRAPFKQPLQGRLQHYKALSRWEHTSNTSPSSPRWMQMSAKRRALHPPHTRECNSSSRVTFASMVCSFVWESNFSDEVLSPLSLGTAEQKPSFTRCSGAQ